MADKQKEDRRKKNTENYGLMTDDNLSFLFFSSFFESGCYRGFIKDFQEQILSKLLPDSHLLPWRIFTDADIHQEAKKPRKTGLNEK